jgi:hypothetical protein
MPDDTEGNALVPKHPDEVTPRSPNADLIPALRKVIAMMDDRRAELAEAGDKVNLAIGAADVAMLADELLAVKKQAAVDIARIVAAEDGPKFFEVPGLGRVEVKGGTERKKWQSTDVLTEVIFRAIVDPETGEWRQPDADAIDLAKAIERNIQTALGMTGSTGWKVGTWDDEKGEWKGGLRSLGIDPDDYCETVPKPNVATIPKRKMTTPEGD